MSFPFSKNGTILDPLIYSMPFYLEIHPECFLMSLNFLLHVVWTDPLFLTSVFLSPGSCMGEILPAPPPQLTQNSASACSLVQGTLISCVECCNAFSGRSTLNLFLESIPTLSAEWPLENWTSRGSSAQTWNGFSLRGGDGEVVTEVRLPASLPRLFPSGVLYLPAVTPWLFLEHAPALGALAVIGTYVIGSGFFLEHSLPTITMSAPQRERRHEEHKWALPCLAIWDIIISPQASWALLLRPLPPARFPHGDPCSPWELGGEELVLPERNLTLVSGSWEVTSLPVQRVFVVLMSSWDLT